jgi:hypothetical protein
MPIARCNKPLLICAGLDVIVPMVLLQLVAVCSGASSVHFKIRLTWGLG